MPPTNSDSAAFEIKSGAVNLPVLRLASDDLEWIAVQLEQKISQAPDFFRHAPMVIDLHELVDVAADLDFCALAALMRKLGLIPVGVCGASHPHLLAARAADLPHLTLARHEPAVQASQQAKAPPVKAAAPILESSTKIVSQPVRSGQRIYAAGGDLVVLAQVSAGAEIMADGNIHVYGALRGRALAGVQGNLACRIFCHDLQAELVAIGGQYKISESIEDSVRGVPVQVYLQNGALIIEKI